MGKYKCGDKVQIEYDSTHVEKFFVDWNYTVKRIGIDHTKSLKKIYNHLCASNDFSIFLKLKAGKPEPLYGNFKDYYSVRLSKNYRLIIKPQCESLSPESLKNCKVIKIRGVDDYHGGKSNWIIP